MRNRPRRRSLPAHEAGVRHGYGRILSRPGLISSRNSSKRSSSRDFSDCTARRRIAAFKGREDPLSSSLTKQRQLPTIPTTRRRYRRPRAPAAHGHTLLGQKHGQRRLLPGQARPSTRLSGIRIVSASSSTTTSSDGIAQSPSPTSPTRPCPRPSTLLALHKDQPYMVLRIATPQSLPPLTLAQAAAQLRTSRTSSATSSTSRSAASRLSPPRAVSGGV